MRTISVNALTKETFSDFGSFYNMLKPDGHTLGNFFHDHVLMPVSGCMPVGFSSMVISKPEDKMLVTKAEYHNTTGEVLLPLDDDIIIYTTPPSNKPVPDKTKAFLVPCGTIVLMNAGVWHFTPFPVHLKESHVMVALPERTYAADCTIVDYDPSEYMEIKM
ncbi:MAG TPA: ureidoglycolate hydrolase [Treponema sp.]|nr:ureidoglycolate hydrolase [Treponema sp.]